MENGFVDDQIILYVNGSSLRKLRQMMRKADERKREKEGRGGEGEGEGEERKEREEKNGEIGAQGSNFSLEI